MNGTQDRETALLREKLAKLLSTLKNNRENVPLDTLKTKYKKAYGACKADRAARHPYPQGLS